VTVAVKTSLDEDAAVVSEMANNLLEAYDVYNAAKSTVRATLAAIHEIGRERLALVRERLFSSQTLVDMVDELPSFQAALARPPEEIAEAVAERDDQFEYLEACMDEIERLGMQLNSGDFGEEDRETVASKYAAAMKEAFLGRNELSILNAKVLRKVKDREKLEADVIFMEAEIPRIRARLPELEDEIRGKEEEKRRLQSELDEQLLARNGEEAKVDDLLVQCHARETSFLDRVELERGFPRLSPVDSGAISGRSWQRMGEDRRKHRGHTTRLPGMGESGDAEGRPGVKGHSTRKGRTGR
jgi:chromosome segregation ATPase